MKRASWAILVSALAAAAPAHASPPLVPRDLRPLARHAETLLRVDPAAAAAAAELRTAQGRLLDPGLGVWAAPSGEAVRLIPALARAGALREFAPDRPLRAAQQPASAEPLLHLQWWRGAVGADRVEPPGPGVPLTVVDSGIDLSHPEFLGRPDLEVATPQTVVGPDEFHGTSVASIAAAPANGVGIVGVYPRALLRTWDVSPSGSLSTEQLVLALADAGRRGRGVVNLSLGGPFRDPIVEDAVLAAFDRGVVVVAASGNAGDARNEQAFPAALPHVLTVGAVGRELQPSPFSTRSAAVDLAAPGESIPAAVPLAEGADPHVLADGTSFAAPIVAGAAAWLWTARPELDKTQVLDILRRTARDLAVPGRDVETGLGLLDIPAALAAPAPPPDPQEPNDDVEQVVPRGLFAAGKAPLTRPGRGRGAVAAALDAVEDPVDVYRVWLPPGRRVTAKAASKRDLALELWRPGATTVLAGGSRRRANLVARSDRPGGRIETVAARNAGRRGAYVYVGVAVGRGAALPDLTYRLTVTTSAAASRPRR